LGEIVNLRRARKARDRRDAAAQAQENRAAFGRPKNESALTAARIAQEGARLDAHRLDGGLKGRPDAEPETHPDA
jgi:hypothetical protein